MTEIASFQCPTRVHFGEGAAGVLPGIVTGAGWSRVLLVVDPALVGGAVHARLVADLAQAGARVTEYAGIDPEPKDTNVTGALDAMERGTEAIVVLGGGSAIDVAKAVGIVATNGGAIADYEGIEAFSTAPLPLVAIPTTAGTGSEVSGAAVITDTARRVKMAIRHARFGPATHAILDPAAVATAPAHVALHAGVDAFVHAFESYLSKLANPFTDAWNLRAMRLIARNLRPFVANRANTGAALNMLCGSSMAAMSFGTTGTGNVHCMAMAIGGLYPVPHGLANAVCLPHVAEFNFIAAPDRYAQVAEAMGEDVRGLDELAAGRRAIAAIRAICEDLSVPSRFRDIGVEETALEEIADRCFALDYNRWNPRQTSREDFLQLLRRGF
ncbi:iron-containing alcohol dehydrogenase [Salipiger mucosus]|uniref:Alcohol dehydrogenase 2 n=1 Tax=Salipiger mucosus DSM 16094 TaxID=1123237 RepID=S9RBT1_9RHOB|nr:iron-containing alcohol dehydrogenase [Salipiger mucosus]EPX75565.1 Alcohol dehydrogenase [Salipiger mucosus DSM 16094]